EVGLHDPGRWGHRALPRRRDRAVLSEQKCSFAIALLPAAHSWCLDFAASLQLGIWILELSHPFALVGRAAHRSSIYQALKFPTPLPSLSAHFHTQLSRSLPPHHNQSPAQAQCTSPGSARCCSRTFLRLLPIPQCSVARKHG